MKIAHINTLSEGSTGRIMLSIADKARQTGYEVCTFSSKVFRKFPKASYKDIEEHRYYGSELSNLIHKVCGQLSGFNGFFSVFATVKLVRMLRKESVELIHLHNLHEFCINLPILFRYVKRKGIKVVWTLHDCWSYTGHCPYYSLVKCDRWKTGCGKCPQKRIYPRTILDTTNINWNEKKKLYGTLNHLTIVTPSQWLANEAAKSFLSCYPIKTINNGIDLTVFAPVSSDFREKYGLVDKYMVLGVASDWGIRKGLDVFADLATRLPEDYQIVLVGGNEQTDRMLPVNIISIHRTQNQKELAEIYSAADVFVNPTREDNFPTVNIESLACGTPIVTFDTGGSPEVIDETCGIVVSCDDVEAMEWEILRVCEGKPFSKEACVRRAKKFDMLEKFGEYVDLYREITDKQ